MQTSVCLIRFVVPAVMAGVCGPARDCDMFSLAWHAPDLCYDQLTGMQLYIQVVMQTQESICCSAKRKERKKKKKNTATHVSCITTVEHRHGIKVVDVFNSARAELMPVSQWKNCFKFF